MQDLLLADMWEERQKAKRATAHPAAPATTSSYPRGSPIAAMREVRAHAREINAFQAEIQALAPKAQDNPTLAVLNSNSVSKLFEAAGGALNQVVGLWKEEHVMGKAVAQMAAAEAKYKSMIEAHNAAIQLRIQHPEAAAQVSAPLAPQAFVPSGGFPRPSGLAGQVVGLAQEYGQVPQTVAMPTGMHAASVAPPPQFQASAPPMPFLPSAPNAGVPIYGGMPGVGVQSTVSPFIPGPSPGPTVSDLQAQLQKLAADNADLQDKLALYQSGPKAPEVQVPPAQQNTPPVVADGAAAEKDVVEEGIDPSLISDELSAPIAQENPARIKKAKP